MALPKDFTDRLMKDYGVTLAALGDEDHAEAYFKCLELGYQRGLEAALAALPEKFTPVSYGAKYGKGSFKRDANEMAGYNDALDQARENIERLKDE